MTQPNDNNPIRVQLWLHRTIWGKFRYAAVTLEGENQLLYVYMTKDRSRSHWYDVNDYLEPEFVEVIGRRFNVDNDEVIPVARFAVKAPFPIPYESVQRRLDFYAGIHYLLSTYDQNLPGAID